MSEKNKNGSDNVSGSPEELIQSGPDTNNGAGEPGDESTKPSGQSDGGDTAGKTVPVETYEDVKTQHEELEKKFGIQGQELGDLRTFIRNIEPVLDNLEKNPELLQALVDGKIDAQVAKSVLEGKLDAGDAQKVTEAHDKVKKDMGKKDYSDAKPEEIEAKVREELSKEFDSKIANTKQEIERKFEETNNLRDFKQGVEEFIKETTDFEDYAEGITKWLEDNPNQDDIKIAYKAVKADTILEKQKKDDDKLKGDAAKDIAANAGGGQSSSANVVSDKNIVDDLINSTSNPNAF